jgi:hypothetical protein
VVAGQGSVEFDRIEFFTIQDGTFTNVPTD